MREEPGCTRAPSSTTTEAGTVGRGVGVPAIGVAGEGVFEGTGVAGLIEGSLAGVFVADWQAARKRITGIINFFKRNFSTLQIDRIPPAFRR